MSLKLRLILMNFLQFFVWGSWLISIGAYWFQNKHWSGTQFGAIFSTMGIASLFMPTIAGILADRWINAERLYGVLHLLGAVLLLVLPSVEDPGTFFWVILLTMMCYMPTIALAIAVSYNALKQGGEDIVQVYPPIRVWGTVGFVVALWVIALLHLGTSAGQFYVAAAAAVVLGLYAFTLPPCPPKLGRPFDQAIGDPGKLQVGALDAFGRSNRFALLADTFGLRAFTLFKNPKLAIFFIFAMLLGAALQLTNAYGDTFLHDFAKLDAYKNGFAVRYPEFIMSISQISETLCILLIPFFLKRFGIKTVMLLSMIAWTLRFGLFAYGDPGTGLWMVVLSCIVYGLAFDFFNISGSLFVEGQSDEKIRASAQGLFMLMTNGIGAVLGSTISGYVIDRFFTDHACNEAVAICKNWPGIWTAFALYTLVTGIAFALLFKHKHDPETLRDLHPDVKVGA
ncbi:MAG TPA: nucleoside permease [Rhodanobacteraceae bacterium]|nr:nucleoside permease [Rhodanobacteraceae bacterium]